MKKETIKSKIEALIKLGHTKNQIYSDLKELKKTTINWYLNKIKKDEAKKPV